MPEENKAQVQPQPQPEKSAPSRRKRRWPWILGAIVVVVALAAVFLPYVLPTSWLRGTVQNALQSSLNRPVSIGDISWGWGGRVDVENVVIGEAAEFGEGDFLTTKELQIRMRLLRLIRGDVVVASITVDSPEITLIRNRDGRWNYETLVADKPAEPAEPRAEEGKPREVQIEKIRVRDGRLTVTDRVENTTMAAAGLSALFDADYSGPAITGDAQVSFDLVQSSGTGRVELAAADIRIPRSQTGKPLNDVAVGGTLTLTGVNIAEMLAAVPEMKPDMASGTLSVSLDYTVRDGLVSVVAENGRVQNLVLGTGIIPEGPARVGDVAFSVDATADRGEEGTTLDLRSLALRTAFADITASGRAAMSPEGEVTAASGRAAGAVTPAALPRGLVTLPADLETSGPLVFEASLKGPDLPSPFTLAVRTSDMAVRYGTVFRKPAGTPLALTMDGQAGTEAVNAQSLALTLGESKVSGSAAFDRTSSTATWDLTAVMNALDVNAYYPKAQGLVVNGAVATRGRFTPAAGDEPARMAADTTFNNFALDATERPGTELAINGDVLLDQERARIQGLSLDFGGSPLVAAGTVTQPLEAPAGTITVTGQEINVDNALAVIDALTATVPSGEAEEAPQPDAQEPAPQEGAPAEDEEGLVQRANLQVDVRVDRIIYQETTGSNLVVTANLAAGRLTSRATAEMFGGTVDLTADADLAEGTQPFNSNVSVTSAKAAEPTAKMLSKYIPGLGFSGDVDLALDMRGLLDAPQATVLQSLSGGGNLDVTNGSLALAGLPEALSALLGGIDLENLSFDRLTIPLQLKDGALTYKYAIPADGATVTVDGLQRLDDGYSQTVGYMPRGASTAVRLMTIENGRPRFVEPQQLVADLAKLQLGGGLGQILRGEEAPPGEAPPAAPATPEEQLQQGIGGVLDILRQREEEKERERQEEQRRRQERRQREQQPAQ